MSEYETVIKAVDTIMSFLNTHESNSTTCLWESDIDGAILKTDWGYFEEGLDEIRDYCDRLKRAEQTEPNVVMPKKCKGCDSASKIIEAYSRGYTDGADAVKKIAEQTEPQTMYYPQVDGITPSVIQKVGYATDSVTGEILGMTLDTDCAWK